MCGRLNAFPKGRTFGLQSTSTFPVPKRTQNPWALSMAGVGPSIAGVPGPHNPICLRAWILRASDQTLESQSSDRTYSTGPLVTNGRSNTLLLSLEFTWLRGWHHLFVVENTLVFRTRGHAPRHHVSSRECIFESYASLASTRARVPHSRPQSPRCSWSWSP